MRELLGQMQGESVLADDRLCYGIGPYVPNQPYTPMCILSCFAWRMYGIVGPPRCQFTDRYIPIVSNFMNPWVMVTFIMQSRCLITGDC